MRKRPALVNLCNMSDTPPNPQRLQGRFVVEFSGSRDTGLTAEAIREHLSDPEWGALGIYKIHRVDEKGQLELVGVEDEDFDDDGGIFLTAADVKGARAGYERLIEYARQLPPPCRIALHMARLGSGDQRQYVVALELPAICLDSTGRWLDIASPEGLNRGERGVEALTTYQTRQPDIIIRDTLLP